MEDTIKIELLTPLTGTFLPNEMEQDWEGEKYHELEEERNAKKRNRRRKK